jgi:predicted methyltransferase
VARWLAIVLLAAYATSVAAEPAPPPPCPASPRDKIQKPDHVIALAGIAPGMTVVDLGAGDGYFTCHLSRAVGPHGHVIATELNPSKVVALRKLVARSALANVSVVQAPANDVGILGLAHRILLVNVWHHLPDRTRYAARIANALARDGKVVVLDFKPGGGHGIAPERLLAELAAGGITAALVEEDLPDQYAIIGSVRDGP